MGFRARTGVSACGQRAQCWSQGSRGLGGLPDQVGQVTTRVTSGSILYFVGYREGRGWGRRTRPRERVLLKTRVDSCVLSLSPVSPRACVSPTGLLASRPEAHPGVRCPLCGWNYPPEGSGVTCFASPKGTPVPDESQDRPSDPPAPGARVPHPAVTLSASDDSKHPSAPHPETGWSRRGPRELL